MNTSTTILIEVCKLIAQFFGAFLIARLAVRWALRRYKSEKTWERQLSAYVDAVTALSEMRQVVGSWSDEVLEHRSTTPEHDAELRDRYQKSKRRLDEGVAAALLLLPKDTAKLLSGLEREIQRSREGYDQLLDLDSQYEVLDKALKRLIAEGRRVLETDAIVSNAIEAA